MTELKFAVMALGRVSEEFQTRLLVYDGKVKACRARNEVWEALLFSAARFFQLLRGVKYKLINMESLKEKKKRRADYLVLKPHYENALGLRAIVVDQLQPGTRCVGCQTDLGGRDAQLPLTLTGSWRVTDTPFLLRLVDTDSTKLVVTCGRKASCNSIGERLLQGNLNAEREALMRFLPDCKICHGCSRFSLETHRCSRCRRARYCSQDCLDRTWGEHKVRCRPFCRPGTSDLYGNKRLKGEERESHAADCLRLLGYLDPSLAAANDGGF